MIVMELISIHRRYRIQLCESTYYLPATRQNLVIKVVGLHRFSNREPSLPLFENLCNHQVFGTILLSINSHHGKNDVIMTSW